MFQLIKGIILNHKTQLYNIRSVKLTAFLYIDLVNKLIRLINIYFKTNKPFLDNGIRTSNRPGVQQSSWSPAGCSTHIWIDLWHLFQTTLLGRIRHWSNSLFNLICTASNRARSIGLSSTHLLVSWLNTHSCTNTHKYTWVRSKDSRPSPMNIPQNECGQFASHPCSRLRSRASQDGSYLCIHVIVRMY